MKRVLVLVLLGVCASSGAWSAPMHGATPAAPSPSATPSPSPSPSVEALPIPLAPAEGKRILKEYRKALKTEAKALDHRQKFELKELEASQRARRKEWLSTEKTKLEDTLRNEPKGPKKREAVQEYMARLKALDQLIKDERLQRVRSQQARKQALKEDQELRLKEFEQFIQKNIQPPSRLWPQPGI